MIAPDGFSLCERLGRCTPALPPSELTVIGGNGELAPAVHGTVLLARDTAGV